MRLPCGDARDQCPLRHILPILPELGPISRKRAIEFEFSACESETSEIGNERCVALVVERIGREHEDLKRQIATKFAAQDRKTRLGRKVGTLSKGFADAESKWRAWATAECDLRVARFGSGSGAGKESVCCEAELDEARLWELRDLLN